MFKLSENDNTELVGLLRHFARTSYTAASSNDLNRKILENATNLLSRDFRHVNIDNSNGQLCDSYPEVIPFILNKEISDQEAGGELAELLKRCHKARARNRFPVPVIRLGNRLVCRSASLSAANELFYKNTREFFRNFSWETETGFLPNREVFDSLRGNDVQLLNYLGVGCIVDLMLENCKHEYGIKVTSSEKVDKENRYSSFAILSLPFPGGSHFADWVDHGYVASGLRFNWSQERITATMKIPENLVNKIDLSNGDPELADLEELDLSKWPTTYQKWDTITLVLSYLKLLLKLVVEQEPNNGILLHCISGWDRTPMFISLARLSLWADGSIHQSLNAAEILYFTVAYDWFLFSHDLVDRSKKRQEIFRFCFSMLRDIESEDFSVTWLTSDAKSPRDKEKAAEIREFRRGRLATVRLLFENALAMSFPKRRASAIPMLVSPDKETPT